VVQTARYAGEVLLDEQLYLASPADVLSVHPGLEELVTQLTGELQELPTAALAQIALPIVRWRDLRLSTRGTLLGPWRPKELA
jgi:hypothetical protein